MAEQRHDFPPLSQRTKTILSILSTVAGIAALVTVSVLLGGRSSSRA